MKHFRRCCCGCRFSFWYFVSSALVSFFFELLFFVLCLIWNIYAITRIHFCRRWRTFVSNFKRSKETVARARIDMHTEFTQFTFCAARWYADTLPASQRQNTLCLLGMRAMHSHTQTRTRTAGTRSSLCYFSTIQFNGQKERAKIAIEMLTWVNFGRNKCKCRKCQKTENQTSNQIYNMRCGCPLDRLRTFQRNAVSLSAVSAASRLFTHSSEFGIIQSMLAQLSGSIRRKSLVAHSLGEPTERRATERERDAH